MSITSLLISQIRRDVDTQARVATDRKTAGEYAQSLAAGKNLPSPVIFFDGKHYWIGDGWHTILAHEINGIKFRRINVDLRHGTKRDAILYAAGANAQHGIRRTAEDIRRAVFLLLQDEEWSQQPNTWIAEHVGIDEKRVRQLKKEIAEVEDSDSPRTQKVENGVENWDEEAEIAKLPADEQAGWASMSEEQRQQSRDISDADPADEKVKQIEDLIHRVLMKIGDGKATKVVRDGLRCYADKVRLAAGWDRRKEPDLTEELLVEVKPLFDQIRRKHAGLPGERVLTRKLEAVWEEAGKQVSKRTM